MDKTKYGDSSKPISVYADIDALKPATSSTVGLRINIFRFTLDLSIGLEDIGLYGSLTEDNVTSSIGLKLDPSELKFGIESSIATQRDNTTQTDFTNASLSAWPFIAVGVFLTTGYFAPLPAH